MSNQELCDGFIANDKSEEIVRIKHEHGEDNEHRSDVDSIQEDIGHDLLQEDMNSPASRRVRKRITYLANVELLLAIASIAISSALLACASCGTRGATAGSGVWCAVFFVVFAGMCRGNTTTIHPSRIICIFGGAAAYFAVLMFAIKTLEVSQAFQEIPFHASGASLHVVLCCIAAVEFVLILATIVLHMRPGKGLCKGCNSAPDAGHAVLPRILKIKKSQKI